MRTLSICDFDAITYLSVHCCYGFLVQFLVKCSVGFSLTTSMIKMKSLLFIGIQWMVFNVTNQFLVHFPAPKKTFALYIEHVLMCRNVLNIGTICVLTQNAT